MLIANPIYDSAFKYLMKDKRVARHFLSVLLNREIAVEDFMQTEDSYPNIFRDTGFTSQRLDFKATITDEDGTKRKVLIELQKSQRQADIGRFRKYLASNYYDSSLQQHSQEHDEIIAVYILGFSLNIPVAVVRTSKQLLDASTQMPLDMTTDDESFIRKLHHESVFVDITKLTTKMRTRVDRLLSIFNQQYVANPNFKLKQNNSENNSENFTKIQSNYTLDIPEDLILDCLRSNLEDYHMLERLNIALLPEEVRSKMISELEFQAEIESMIQKSENKKFTEGVQQGIEQGKIEIAKQMIKSGSGLSIEQISQFTGLNIKDIENIKI